MTDEDRQRQMDFILAQQAQFSVNMDLLRERVDTLTINVDALTINVGALTTNVEGLRKAQARTDETVSRIATQVELIAHQQSHINEVVAVIADAQQHTDERLSALIDVVQGGRNGTSQ